MSLSDQIASVDFFKRKGGKDGWQWDTGAFVGRPFKLHYNEASVLMADAWKERAKGVAQGCFLLAYYDCDAEKPDLQEAILLRVIEPTDLPTDRDVVSSMVEFYKENIKTGGTKQSQLDQYTRHEFGFSGVRCSVLGCFYLQDGKLKFGADVENFYSAHNYSVVKPSEDLLRNIVNYRSDGIAGGEGDVRLGRVRYSSSERFTQSGTEDVPLYVKATDFAGKRTGLFGMTRTGKSNTIKKVIQANEEMSEKSSLILGKSKESADEVLKPFTSAGLPKYPVGQIIFDINGEYANANLQDAGTAIFDLYKAKTERYSIIEKLDFKVMKVNFYKEIDAGFGLIKSFPSIADDDARFVTNFRSVDLEKPADYATNKSAATRYDRRLAVYHCILYRAKFAPPPGLTVKFAANTEVRTAVDPSVDPSKGLTLEDACAWWTSLWKIYGDDKAFEDYKKLNKKEWADDDLKALLVMLTQCRTAGGSKDCNGYMILREIGKQHTEKSDTSFEDEILHALRAGKIVIADLSSGDEELQRMYSERITRHVFRDSMNRFTSALPNNFIQFYFEEAHNLFPKKEDRDFSQIYNRLAKEGAKLHLGLVYATQELSSISGNILKNTQNWVISHLNNDDEIRELRKYYDFSDFSGSLVRFSQDTDKGFARVKTYSNAFVVPVQIDKFTGTK